MADAPPTTPTTTRQIYRSLATDALVALREAFILDASEATLLGTRLFAEQRLKMIGEILQERRRLARKAPGAEGAD